MSLVMHGGSWCTQHLTTGIRLQADQDAQCTAERRDLLGAVACIRDDVRVLQGRMQALQPAETYLQSLQVRSKLCAQTCKRVDRASSLFHMSS